MIVFGFALGCGTDAGGSGSVDAYLGVYRTTTHVYAAGQGASIPCTTAGMPVTPATPTFSLGLDTFLMDAHLVVLSNCTDAAGADCNETLIDMRSGGPGLEGENANSQTGGGLGCQLHYSRAQATLDGTTIEIESIEKYDAPSISDAECTLERAEALASSPDCRSVERWTGTKL